MAKKMSRGRPPKPARLRRTRRLPLMLTTAEYIALNRYCARHGMSASEVVRGCLRRLLEDDLAAHVGAGVAAKKGAGL